MKVLALELDSKAVLFRNGLCYDPHTKTLFQANSEILAEADLRKFKLVSFELDTLKNVRLSGTLPDHKLEMLLNA